MYKELHFVYIVDGETFLDEEEAKEDLEKINKERR